MEGQGAPSDISTKDKGLLPTKGEEHDSGITSKSKSCFISSSD
jgi:hypothetical protein